MSNIYNLPSKLSARKAVILSRVSSKEQEEGYSIEAQKHRLELYCQRRDLSVIKTFEITESSTKGDRKKFIAMMGFIKRQKIPIALIADKVDRLQRSFKEYALLDGLIQEGKIELHFNTENYVIHQNSVSQERMMWSMGVMMAQSYVDSMRDNIKRSIDHKIMHGEWPALAPLGYLNIRNEKGRSDLIIDPERGLLVRKLFQEYSTGLYTIPELTKKAKVWGLKGKGKNQTPLCRSYVHRMLNNPFYYGIMEIKDVQYPHKYEPLIDKYLFNQCQAVLKGWKKQPFEYGKKDYVFRGLINCATTGITVTSDTKTKTYKSGKTSSWTYLRCHKPEDPTKKQWVREEKVLAQVEAVIKRLHIPEDILKKIIAYIRATDHTEREFLNRQLDELYKEQKLIQGRMSGLLDLLVDKVIDQQEYRAKKAELQKQQNDLDIQIKGNRVGDDSFKDTLITLVSLCSEAPTLFKGSTNTPKRLLLKMLFTNLQLVGDKLLYSLNKPFDLFVQTEGLEKWSELVDSLRTCNTLRDSILNTETFCKKITKPK